MSEGVLPRRFRDVDESVNRLTYDIIGAAMEVQSHLGLGLLESAYQAALAHELGLRGHAVQTKVACAADYKGLLLPKAYEVDLIVDDAVLVELKAVAGLAPSHFGQLATYLKFRRRRVGLLINFHASPLKAGIHRVLRDADNTSSVPP